MMSRALFLASLLACTSADGSAPDAGPAMFIAVRSDFAPYASWPSFYVGTDPPPDAPDLAGPRTVFINRMPPAGAKTFPVGTIIVKRIEVQAAPQSWQLFGMVKRGGGYDDGAPGWEFFGLSIDAQSYVAIDWRGVGPPPDGSYGGLASSIGCVFCHANAKTNDYVQTPALALGN
jgi:hypothetical protein